MPNVTRLERAWPGLAHGRPALSRAHCLSGHPGTDQKTLPTKLCSLSEYRLVILKGINTKHRNRAHDLPGTVLRPSAAAIHGPFPPPLPVVGSSIPPEDTGLGKVNPQPRNPTGRWELGWHSGACGGINELSCHPLRQSTEGTRNKCVWLMDRIKIEVFLLLLLLLFWSFRATLVAYSGSQARGPIGLHHSPSNAGFELCL